MVKSRTRRRERLTMKGISVLGDSSRMTVTPTKKSQVWMTNLGRRSRTHEQEEKQLWSRRPRDMILRKR